MASLAEQTCSDILESRPSYESDSDGSNRSRMNLKLPIPARIHSPEGSRSTPRLLGCPQNLTGVVADMKLKMVQEQTNSLARTRQVASARRLSVFSLIASLLIATLAICVGVSESALSLVGFGGELLLDGISSAFVLWRFKHPKEQKLTETSMDLSKRLERDARRERNASLGIGITFVMLACFLFTSAVWKFIWWDASDSDHQKEEREAAIYSSVLVWISATLFGGLAFMKFQLAKALQSQVLQKDALCSMLGGVLGFIVGVSDIVAVGAEDDPEILATVDPVAGLIIAVILLLEGCRTLWQNRHGVMHEDEPQPLF